MIVFVLFMSILSLGAEFLPSEQHVGICSNYELAYLVNDGSINIYTVNMNDETVQQLTDRDSYKSSLAWSPDGKYLSYYEGTSGDSSPTLNVLSLSNSDVHEFRKQTVSSADYSWSPANDRIAFVADVDDYPNLFTLDLQTGDTVQITFGAETRYNMPRWSPDGLRLAYLADQYNYAAIHLFDFETSQEEQLTAFNLAIYDMNWSPDSTAVLFSSSHEDHEAPHDIFVLDAADKSLTNLTNHEAADGFPSWSPDGSLIIFLSNRDGNHNLYLMDADGENVKPLAANTTPRSLGYWSPDSQWIAYLDNEDNDLYVVSANDGETRRVIDIDTPPLNSPYNIAWRPCP